MKKIHVVVSSMILAIAISTIIIIIAIGRFSGSNSVSDIFVKDLASSEQVSIEFSDKPSVLLFFTTWCPYCNDDAPKMVELYNKYKDEVNVYGINVINRDVLSEVKQYVEQYQIEYPVLLDESNQLYEKYGEKGFPSMFFVDTNGKTKDRIIGSTDISVIEESFLDLINSH